MKFNDLRDVLSNLDGPDSYICFELICFSNGKYDFSDPTRESKNNYDWDERLSWDQEANDLLNGTVVRVDGLLYSVVFTMFGSTYYSEFIPV
jgi:hypothetical protein